MTIQIRKKFVELADFGPLRLRLQRFGQNKLPFYNIVAAQARFRRNGRVHDVLGTYCPIATSAGTKHITLDFQKVKYWIAAGAEPTGMVAKILSKAGLFPSPPKASEIAKRQQINNKQQ
jgi:small subunit ribosomal protein S16